MPRYNTDSVYDNQPRIVGTEAEYTTRADPDDLFNFIGDIPSLQSTVSQRDYSSLWTPNGGNLYSDCGDNYDWSGGVLEFATPECLSGHEAELHSRVGEWMANCLAGLEEAITHDAPEGAILVSKRSGYVNVRNSKGDALLSAMSTGQHENYFAPRLIELLSNDDASAERAADQISSYLCTRGSWAGVGIVAQDGFRTTQKFEAMEFNGGLNKITHGSKSPFNKFCGNGRFEIRSGDGNMSSQVAIDVADLSSLIVRMVEHDAFPEALIVVDPSLAMRDSSVPGRLIQTCSGAMTGAEHQRRIVEAALEFASHFSGIPTHEVAAAEHVLSTCNDIELFDGSTDTLELIAGDVEWAAKLLYIRRHVAKGAITAANLEAVRYDLHWEDTSPTKSPSRKWYATHGDPFTEAEITHAITRPPKTRALARTEILHSGDSIMSASWSYIHTPDGDYRLPDPYNPNIPLLRPK